MIESVNYADLTELARDLTRAADDVEVATQELLVHAGTQVEAAAISEVPVKTGNLRNSIRMWVGNLRVTIGPDPLKADYGTFVEYGTGTRGEFPGAAYEIRPKNASVLRFKVGGRWVYARVVHHPGIAAHPYMRPALQTWVDSLGEDAAKVGVQMIVGSK